MDPTFLLSQAIGGLATATLLFLVASGLSLIFGVGNVFNFAHGSFYLLGSYLAYQVIGILGVPFWAGLVLAAVGAGVLGALMEWLFLRRIYGRSEEGAFQILLTFCFILIIDDLVKIVWGTEYKSLSRPAALGGVFDLGGAMLPKYYVLVIAAGLCVMLVSWYVLQRTRVGRVVRASALDREMLGALGVNVPLTMTLVFGVATALGGLAGALAAPLRTVTPGAGAEVIIDSLIVVVLGGLGNFWGAWVGALIIGEVYAFGILWLPRWANLLSFVVMVLVLVVKPEGLFAPKVGREGRL